jgi:ABC-type bacteriocin/lantibiotic exporter with double-glycine peptidase domain
MLTLVSTVVSMAAFGYCLYRVWNGQILYGDMTFFLQQRANLTNRFDNLVNTIPGMLNSSVSAHRIRELIDLPREATKSRLLRRWRNRRRRGSPSGCTNVSFTIRTASNRLPGRQF